VGSILCNFRPIPAKLLAAITRKDLLEEKVTRDGKSEV
jgi:hypothetical protein